MTKISMSGYKRTSKDKNEPALVIPSNQITMKGVDFPVFGMSDTGDAKMMYPGLDYSFGGNYVHELPMARGGYIVPGRFKNPEGNWLNKYQVGSEVPANLPWINSQGQYQEPPKTSYALSDEDLRRVDISQRAETTDTPAVKLAQQVAVQKHEDWVKRKPIAKTPVTKKQNYTGKIAEYVKNEDKKVIDAYYKNYDKSNEDAVKSIQSELVAKNFLPGSAAIDGKFGDKTKQAYVKYKNAERVGDLSSETKKSTCTYDGCAEYVSSVTRPYGWVLGDAWTMKNNIETNGGTVKYNIYTDPKFSKVKSKDQLKSVTENVKRTNKATPDIFQVGDVVGLYYKGSDMHQTALKDGRGTYNTHVGVVTEIKDGKPVISHNIHGKLHHDPYDNLTIGWVGTPAPRMAQYKPSKQPETLKDKINVYSKELTQILAPGIDSEKIANNIKGILRKETGLGKLTPSESDVKEIQAKRYVLGESTNVKDISRGIGKLKTATIPNDMKYFLGINDESIDDDAGVKAAVYKYVDAYNQFKKYSDSNPQLNLTDDDLHQMSILAYNQGTDKLLNLGYNNPSLPISSEVDALRDLYNGNVKDISSTNFKYLPSINTDIAGIPINIDPGQALYDYRYPEGHESYISRVNKYANTPIEELEASMQSKKDGGWLSKYQDGGNLISMTKSINKKYPGYSVWFDKGDIFIRNPSDNASWERMPTDVTPIKTREARLDLKPSALAPITSTLSGNNTAAVLSSIKEEDMYKRGPRVVPAPDFKSGGWLDKYQVGKQVPANLPWINNQGQYAKPNSMQVPSKVNKALRPLTPEEIDGYKASDSTLENIAEIIDPTGLFSHDDAKRAYDSWNASGRVTPTLQEDLDMFSAVPGLGKFGKYAYATYADEFSKPVMKSIPWQQIVNLFGTEELYGPTNQEHETEQEKKKLGGWLERYQDGRQVPANLSWIGNKGQVLTEQQQEEKLLDKKFGIGPTVDKAEAIKAKERLKKTKRIETPLPSGAITPVMGPVEYALMAPVAASSIMKAAPIIGSAMNAPIAGLPGVTAGNALSAGFAADAAVNRLPQLPGQLSRGEYADAAVNAVTGLLDVGTAGMLGPLYKGAKTAAQETNKYLQNKYLDVAEGSNPFNYAWKSPAERFDPAAVPMFDEAGYIVNSMPMSEEHFRKIKNLSNLTDDEKYLIKQYEKDSRPFTGRNDKIDLAKRNQLDDLLRRTEVITDEPLVMTRRIKSGNPELFNLKNGVYTPDRPTSWSAGRDAIGNESYSGGADRMVMKLPKGKNRVLKNPYESLNADQLARYKEELRQKGITDPESIEYHLSMFNENRPQERELLLDPYVDLKKMGKVKNSFGGYDYVMKPKFYKNGGWLEAYQDGSQVPQSWKDNYDWTSNVEEEYQQFKNDPNAPENLRFTDDMKDYNTRGMWDSLDRPSNWQQALDLHKQQQGYEWTPEDDGYYHAWSQHPGTGEWLKPRHHSTGWMNYMGYAFDPENTVVVNPEGFFGNDTLQAYPKQKKKYGGPTPAMGYNDYIDGYSGIFAKSGGSITKSSWLNKYK